jgi:hypothetical protein
VNEGTRPGKTETELEETAAKEWTDLLNKMGKSGWELVSEQTVVDGVSVLGTFQIEFGGTMKRPGSPL